MPSYLKPLTSVECTIEEITWVARALSCEDNRPALHHAIFAHWDGDLVLLATDAYRLHLLRLFPGSQSPLPEISEHTSVCDYYKAIKPIDLRPVLSAAKAIRSHRLHIATDLSKITMRQWKSNELTLERREYELDRYPYLLHILSDINEPVTKLRGFHPTHWRDACALARGPDACVTITQGSSHTHPVVIRPHAGRPRWTAVIMTKDIGGLRCYNKD